jgi:three-Cys-motif partner protein
MLYEDLTKKVAEQLQFGGAWTQQKLDALSKYLRAYTKIFKKNPRARFFSITYVDAFAGTGRLRGQELGPLIKYFPGLAESAEEYRKGSVRRALEIEPPFDEYIFIEKDSEKCEQLKTLAALFPSKNIEVINDDANNALLQWCRQLDKKRERAVVFLDPFGASVEWKVISALGRTRAVDLWILFPFFAVNRMLIRNRKPPAAWATRLTKVFGTRDWENEFYSSTEWESLLDPNRPIKLISKTADPYKISEFFMKQLRNEFEKVSEPLALHNSNGSLLFLLYFAAANERSAETGMKIANSIIGS